MDPSNPADAQQIVIEYVRVLERDIAEHRLPARLDSLPFSKPTIRSAIQASVVYLRSSGQLTDDLRDYFETAYTSLAEYLEPEFVALLTTYRDSAEELAGGPVVIRDKTGTAAWRTLVESSTLMGELARGAAEEAETLRREFQSFASSE